MLSRIRVVRAARAVAWALSFATAASSMVHAQTSAVQTASPQAPGPATRVTFSDAVRIALKQNITLRQAQNVRALNATSVSQARNQFLPNLSLTASTSENVGRNFNQTLGQITDQSSQSVSPGISSNVTLFNGFANISALRQARLSEDASVSDVARARQTVVFTVASNFLSLVTLQEQQVVQERNLVAQQALEAQIQRLVTAGSKSIADLYQQQATVASAVSAVVTAKRSVELAKVDVIQTLQLDASQTYEFVAPAVDTTASSPGFKLDDLLARAFAERADLKADGVRVDVALEALKSSTATRWPTIGLSLGYNSSYSSLTNLGIFPQFEQRRSGSLGLSLSVPIFDRGSANIASQQSTIQADNARLTRERTRQTVALDIRRAFLDYQSAVDQISATQAQQRAADLALSATQQRYNVGAATLVELTQAQVAQLAAAVALVNARFTLVFQQSLMSYYTGDLDPSSVTFGRS